MVIEFLAPVTAAIIAGLGWSTLGIWNHWRNNEDSTIDFKKLRKNIIIGAGIGVVTWGYGAVNGQGTEIINTLPQFATAIAAYFPIVVVVDKILNRE
jgi:hypothetical protein